MDHVAGFCRHSGLLFPSVQRKWILRCSTEEQFRGRFGIYYEPVGKQSPTAVHRKLLGFLTNAHVGGESRNWKVSVGKRIIS